MPLILHVTSGPHTGRDYRFDGAGSFVVGRSTQADHASPDDRFLSREHFRVEIDPPSAFLKDLGSTNGTKLNGQRVGEARLRDGDVISAGQCAFRVELTGDWAGAGPARCRNCGRESPLDATAPPAPARAGDRQHEWYCESCRLQRSRFPAPPPGFWVEHRIGGGGMGEVFLARELATGRHVALKMMIPAIAASGTARLRFRREMEVLKSLRHPNIVTYYDMHEEEGQYQLVMEYVHGKNAREWVLGSGRPLPVESALEIGVQLLAALEHAHGRGYVHRDIRPSNLLVSGEVGSPEVKLSDFGLAKHLDEAGFGGLTHQGDVGGSVGFISPDHIRDFRNAREPADIYSAGATLYYLLTGRFPFLDFDPGRANAYTIILEHPSVPLRVHRPDAPEGLERVLRKAMEKRPQERWKSAAAMAEALRKLQADAAPADEPGPP